MRRQALVLGILLLGLAAWLSVDLLLPRASTRAPAPGPDAGRAEVPADPPGPILEGSRNPAAGAAKPRAVEGPRPAGRVRIEGRVLDPDGRPVVGANVRAADAPEPAPETSTGDDGHFVLDLPAPGAFMLLVTAPGLADARVPSTDAAAGTLVRLGRVWTISGTIEDAQSKVRVAGVPVSASPVAAPDTPLRNAVRSRDDGTFAVDVPAPGKYVLHVGAHSTAADSVAGQYVPVATGPVEAGTAELRVLLERGLTIEGRIVDAHDELVAHAVRVIAIGRTASGDRDYTRRRWMEFADGNLRLPGLPAGQYDLWISPVARPDELGSSSASALVLSDVAAGTSGLLVRLRRGLTLTGRVVTEAGEPVLGGGSVVAAREGDRDAALRLGFAAVPGDGTFSFAALEEGVLYDLLATGFTGRRDGAALRVRPGDPRIVVVLASAGRIEGRVRTEDGTPAPAGVPVGAIAPGAAPDAAGARRFVQSDASGRFVLDGLGDFAFDLQAGGGRSGYLGAVLPGVRGGAKDVVLRVSLGVELAGILLDAQGNPVATTSLMADDGSRTAAMRPYDQVGPDGRFLLRGLARGRVRLTAQQGEVHVPVGEVEAPGADVRLTLPAR